MARSFFLSMTNFQ